MDNFFTYFLISMRIGGMETVESCGRKHSIRVAGQVKFSFSVHE